MLVASSPRFPLLLPPQTWRALAEADPVLVLDVAHPTLPALDVAGIGWEVLEPAEDRGPAGRDLLLVGQGIDIEAVAAARRLADAVVSRALQRGAATVLLPPVNDGPLVQLVSDRAVRLHIEIEAVYPVGEPKGSALLDLVAVQTRLRAPGGCPWDAQQTHASLGRHLIEECYEVLDAIASLDAGGDPAHLAEELGDVALQVVFHAQVAEDAGTFDIDAVARSITEKLVRRHPHVFGDVEVDSADQVVANWDTIKRTEEGRTDPLAGIPSALPALQLASKLQRRAASAGFDWSGAPATVAGVGQRLQQLATEPGAAGAPERLEAAVGEVLFAVVALAASLGVDPETALRGTAGRFRERFAQVIAER